MLNSLGFCYKSIGDNPDEARLLTDCLVITKVQYSFTESIMGDVFYFYEAIHSYESARR